MPAPTPPTWRRLFDRLENAIGRPLEQAIGDPRINEALMQGLELSRNASRNWRAATANLLHLRNLPSYSDIRRMERRLGQIEKQLLDLAATLERLEHGTRQRSEECPESAVQKPIKGSARSARKSSATRGVPATD